MSLFRKRFKCFRQTDTSDCGIACIRMVANYLGLDVSMREIRSVCEVNKTGITIRDICDGCKSLGLEPYAFTGGPEVLAKMVIPVIVYWKQKHFVVLYDVDTKHRVCRVADPARGKISINFDDFFKAWTGDNDKGVAIVVGTAPNFKPCKRNNDSVFCRLTKFVKHEFRKYRSMYARVILLSLTCMLSDIVLPLVFQRTVDEGIASRNVGLVWLLVIGQLGLFAGNFTSSTILNYVLTKLGLKVDIEMVGTYLSKLISQPLSFFDCRASSGLIQKISDQSRIKGFLLSMPQTVFFMLINLIVFSTMLVYYSSLIFIIFITLSLAGLLWTIAFLPHRRSIDYGFYSEAAENRNTVYELINGMPEIKTNNAQHIRFNKWMESQKRINRLTIHSTLLGMKIGGGESVISRFKDLIIMGISATMVIHGHLTIGGMMTVTYICGRLAGPFSQFLSAITEVQDAKLSYERLEEVLEARESPTGNGDFVNAGIRLDNIWFRYPGLSSPFVLKDFSIEIHPGQTVAVVGESGCGKTTLIKLMLGFYLPQQGKLTLGGIDINEADRDAWLSLCGVVMQQGYVFSDTVLANVAMSDATPDCNKVMEALRIAGLDDFINMLPMGLNTRIGTTGVEMSGGQRQRLMIARAVYKNPSILFLDEATSSLDARNEAEIVERLRKFHRNRTVVIAAHRLSTVRNADLIIYMADGEIHESGTHDELVQLGGKYFSLVRNQLQLSV